MAAGQTPLQRLPVGLGPVGSVAHRQPAVRDLGSQGHVAGPSGRDPDLDARRGVQDRPERLALAQRARAVVGQPESVPVVGDGLVAGQDLAHDRGVVAQFGRRLPPGRAVPALHHLGPRHAQTDDGAAAPGESVDGHGVHGGGCRAAGVDLHDTGGELDPAGVRGQVCQGRQRVGPVGLSRPHAVVAEPLRELHRSHGHLQSCPPVQVQTQTQLHADKIERKQGAPLRITPEWVRALRAMLRTRSPSELSRRGRSCRDLLGGGISTLNR